MLQIIRFFKGGCIYLALLSWGLSICLPCYFDGVRLQYGIDLLHLGLSTSLHLIAYILMPMHSLAFLSNVFFLSIIIMYVFLNRAIHYAFCLYVLIFNIITVLLIGTSGGRSGILRIPVYEILQHPAVYFWLASFFLLYLALKMEQTK